MDDSSHTPSEISRRRVVQLLGSGAVAAAAGTALSGTTAVAHSNSHTGLIAAVLDDTDVVTNARGLTRLLRNAGFTVVALNPNQPVRLKDGLVPAPAVQRHDGGRVPCRHRGQSRVLPRPGEVRRFGAEGERGSRDRHAVAQGRSARR
ncbi:hypothetical protein ACWGB8_12740 [Kitasatospora sp. NPDC054939]